MEERLPIWEVAVNILNKQSRTADKGGRPVWGLGEVLTTPHHKNISCYKLFCGYFLQNYWTYVMRLERTSY